MIEILHEIERDATRESPVHALDARVKLLLTIAGIIAVVAFPYTTGVYLLGAAFAGFIAVLWLASRLPPRVYAKRLLLILPFGLFIIIFQIFFENPHYTLFTPLAILPFGITIYTESVEFASILLAKFLVSVSFIILLSSTTTVQDMLKGACRLGLPAIMALSLGMMVRYLFVFAGMFDRVTDALSSRCFNATDRTLPYPYRLRTVGYAIGMFFLRSYEQGERTYTSMRCRGYGKDYFHFLPAKPLSAGEWMFLAGSLLLLAGMTAGVYFIT